MHLDASINGKDGHDNHCAQLTVKYTFSVSLAQTCHHNRQDYAGMQ